jgi:FOG: WD40 repeat
VACDDGFVKLFTEANGKLEANLKGHEDCVQDVAFDHNSKMLVSVGSDASFIVWQ